MIRRMNFHPDTCECSFTLEHDDAVAFTGHTCVGGTACPIHAGIGDAPARYATIMEENNLKNDVREWALANYPVLSADYLDINGRTYQDFKTTVTWEWVFDPLTRVLTITFPGVNFNTPQRRAIQTALDTRFGVGRVVLG